MNAMTRLLLIVGWLAAATPALAQTGTDLVEVEPIKCWWRSTTSAVRVAESFGVTLTCAVVDTDSTRVVADVSKLDPTVVALPPFEVIGGTHAGDLVSTGKRFLQFDYRLRLIAEDAFGADVAIPPLEISYRVESKVTGGDTVQGRDLSYSLPRTSVRLISLVPDDTTDIREAPATAFTGIESRDSRGSLLQTVAGVLFGLAGVMALVILFGLLRRKSKGKAAVKIQLPARAILATAASELADVQRAAHGGWSPELAGRALAAARIAGSFASGRAVGQFVAAKDESPLDGQLVVGGGLLRTRMLVSGSITPQSATDPVLAEALKVLTTARYGRLEKAAGDADEAVSTVIRVTGQQRSKHSLLSEWIGALTNSVVGLRKKVWA